MDVYEFDRIMSEPYPEGVEWVVLPIAKPPIDKDIAEFLEKTRYRLMTVFNLTPIIIEDKDE